MKSALLKMRYDSYLFPTGTAFREVNCSTAITICYLNSMQMQCILLFVIKATQAFCVFSTPIIIDNTNEAFFPLTSANMISKWYILCNWLAKTFILIKALQVKCVLIICLQSAVKLCHSPNCQMSMSILLSPECQSREVFSIYSSNFNSFSWKKTRID